MLDRAVAALSIAGAGNLGLIATAAAAEPTSTLAPWIQGGGSAAAVGGLVYMARLIANGRLVPREVKDTEDDLRSDAMAAGQREARAMAIAEAQQRHAEEDRIQRDRLILALDAGNRALESNNRTLETVAREMGEWRRIRGQGVRSGEASPPEGARQ